MPNDDDLKIEKFLKRQNKQCAKIHKRINRAVTQLTRAQRRIETTVLASERLIDDYFTSRDA